MHSLKEIYNALQRISKWPWHIDRDARSGMEWNIEVDCTETNPVGAYLTVAFIAHDLAKTDKHECNGQFIAASPEIISYLLDRVIEAEAMLKGKVGE